MERVEELLELSAAVLRANALRLPLADESVDLIVTSPPYFALRSYRDEGEHYEHQLGSEETPQAFLEALWAVTAECHRVLKPSGSMFVNLGDKYAQAAGQYGMGHSGLEAQSESYREGTTGGYARGRSGGARPKSLLGLPWRYAIGCIDGMAAPDGQRWILRAEVIWSKPNGLPESVTDRVRRSHEQWFHLVRSPRYFSAVDEVREAHAPASLDRDGSTYQRHGRGHQDLHDDGIRVEGMQGRTTHIALNPLGKLPGSVWNIPSEPLIIPEAVQRHYDLPDHFAAFPQELPRRIILGWSPNGVCCACGEGRRPVVAKELGELTWTNGQRVATRSSRGRVGNVTGRDSAVNAQGREMAGRPRPGVGALASWHGSITGYACACWQSHHTDPFGNKVMVPPTRPAVVLDPFGGTGTVAMVARTLGRFGVSVDLSADYNRLAKWRIWESGHGEKAAQRTHRENQGDLFGNASAYEDVEVKEAL